MIINKSFCECVKEIIPTFINPIDINKKHPANCFICEQKCNLDYHITKPSMFIVHIHGPLYYGHRKNICTSYHALFVCDKCFRSNSDKLIKNNDIVFSDSTLEIKGISLFSNNNC